MSTRRQFLTSSAAAPLWLQAQPRRKPNVIVIISDDQGYGDLSLHGNDRLRTPNLDRIGAEGAQFTQFQVCPVCSPTRSSLMTGRYHYRTGVVDTYLGRSMMFPDEVTIAEILSGAGYRTGIFGKWHLGDHHPMRAIDQGFQEALVHGGGGLAQPAGPPGNGYFDPILEHNGESKPYRGYCSDIFTHAAIEFVEANRSRPFFVYLAFNAPHDPLQIDDSYVQPFRAMGLSDTTAKVYGMVTNLDENVGKLLAKLRALDLERDTIVVFLTDNGPQQERYNAGMRGRKGTVYQGGIRVPFFLRWPARVKAGLKVDRIAAHIDLLPTLAEACGARVPKGVKLDGRSLMPLLDGSARPWADRTLFTQWHRGDAPVLFRSCAARTQRYKLVNGRELYDLENDPREEKDVAAAHPEITARLREETEAWFRDVSSTRGFAPPRIYLGTRAQPKVTLTRQDWRGPQAGWEPSSVGYWEVDVRRQGRFAIVFRGAPAVADGEAVFRLGTTMKRVAVSKGSAEWHIGSLGLDSGPGRLEAELRLGSKTFGVHYVDVRSEA